MSLAIDEKLGPYEIVALIGTGGMGEVYRATDTRLHREVAVKISAERFSDRFEREARAVAALNHPNVCTLHDVGPNYLVMELVEGPTLAERIREGPVPLEETLTIARQIANALEAAHERGIVHRDLKPGNIKIKADGTVKVFDFGLAKIAEPACPPGGNPSHSPTLTLEAFTRFGDIVGTVGYMAPEQATGGPVDKRADIFAFGVVMYEMLTGNRLFKGETASETLASVLKDEPNLERIPPKVRPLLQRCLEKEPRKRLRDIGDLDLLLQQPRPGDALLELRGKRPWLPWAVAAVLAASLAVVIFLWRRAPAPEVGSTRFLVDAPGGNQFTNENSAMAVSPDGRYLVFGAGTRGTRRLWLRPLDSLGAQLLQGSEGANHPFWSPNSKSVAFFAGSKLKRSDIDGGAPQVLCDGQFGPGGAWGRDGVILFGGTEGLMRVAASGGVPQRLTQRDTARKESQHSAPQFLPDGKKFLYFIASTDPNIQGIYAGSLDKPNERVRILATKRKAYYAPPRDGRTGFLLWLREQTLLAQPFDVKRLRLEGNPTPLAEGVALAPTIRAAFWISDAGLLVYRTGDNSRGGRLIWMSRDGKRLGEAGKEDRNASFRLSPDGKRVALGRYDGGENADIWVFEFGREVTTRLTSDPKQDLILIPVWSPDGRQIAFTSSRSGIRQIYRKDAGGGGQEDQLTTGPNLKSPEDWSRDGRYLLYSEIAPKTGLDLWALPLNGDRKPVVVLQTPFNEKSGTFSPDGKWIAYDSDASGRPEVYVRAFPVSGDPWQVSKQGGSLPKWRADGKELFYMGADMNKVMAADVRIAGTSFQSDPPRELFPIVPMGFHATSPYDVTPDGQRFLVLETTVRVEEREPLTVVVNWQAGLKK